MQVADINWRMIDGNSFESGLRIWRENEQTPSFLPLPSGTKISWEIRGPKRCIGSVNESGRLIPCPENSVILDGGQKCGSCSAGDIVDPCIRCDGRRCAAGKGPVQGSGDPYMLPRLQALRCRSRSLSHLRQGYRSGGVSHPDSRHTG